MRKNRLFVLNQRGPLMSDMSVHSGLNYTGSNYGTNPYPLPVVSIPTQQGTYNPVAQIAETNRLAQEQMTRGGAAQDWAKNH